MSRHEENADYGAALQGVMDALGRSGWSPGKRERHGKTIGYDWLNEAHGFDECRCGEFWPCPFVRAWEVLDHTHSGSFPEGTA